MPLRGKIVFLRDRGFSVEVGCFGSLSFGFLRVLIWTLRFVLFSGRFFFYFQSHCFNRTLSNPQGLFDLIPCVLYPHDSMEKKAIGSMFLCSSRRVGQPNLFSETFFSYEPDRELPSSKQQAR